VRHVVFRIGKERYGLPLAAVREVVEPATMSRVPCAPPAVLGIMNLRGRVVTVVSLASLLGAPTGEEVDVEAPAGKVVLLDRGRRDLGLLVSVVDGVHELSELAPAPGEVSPAIRGVGRPPSGGAVTVLDAEGLDRQVAGLFAKTR
jgi:purine-binding chemotaxis protein CheW